MSELIEMTWSAASIDEARKVSRFLVQEKIIACAQIIPWIESIYLWNDQMETSQESRVVFKTKKENISKVYEIIKKNSRYEIPEVLWRTISQEGDNQIGGLDEYITWIRDTVNK